MFCSKFSSYWFEVLSQPNSPALREHQHTAQPGFHCLVILIILSILPVGSLLRLKITFEQTEIRMFRML
jgi:hypothetical protein